MRSKKRQHMINHYYYYLLVEGKMKFENKKCINYDFIFKKNCDEKMK
jgi:hypothetical protein